MMMVELSIKMKPRIKIIKYLAPRGSLENACLQSTIKRFQNSINCNRQWRL